MATPARSKQPAAGRVRCTTRALKNARYLQRTAPKLWAKHRGAEGFGTAIPTRVLERLHRLRPDSHELSEHAELRAHLRSHPLPVPGTKALDPLFHGTIHFARVTFRTPARTLSISAADMATIVKYTRHAIVPISAYATQYGPNQLAVSPRVIPYSVDLPGTSFTDAELRRWVDDIVAKHALPRRSCVLIPVPKGLTLKDVDANSGYHSRARRQYSVFGVFANKLTLSDRADCYAMVVSHEICELVVDPMLNQANPEVCDPCDLNCGPLHRAYFDAKDRYLGSTRKLPPPFSFAYYICPMVKPAGAKACPAPANDCNYAPVAV